MNSHARSLVAFVPVSLACALAAAALAASCGEALAARWTHLARAGPRARSFAAVARLRRLGPAGWLALVELARDRTPLPHVRGPRSVLVPPDSVADLALDALRHLREGREAPRPFAWTAAQGVSYEKALELFREEELALALAWLESRGVELRGGLAAER